MLCSAANGFMSNGLIYTKGKFISKYMSGDTYTNLHTVVFLSSATFPAAVQ